MKVKLLNLLSLLFLLAIPPAQSLLMNTEKTLTIVRHGQTEANEYLSTVCRWGSSNFRDTADLRDSKLNSVGIEQASVSLRERMNSLKLPSGVAEDDMLMLVSPLSRTLETMRLGCGYASKSENSEAVDSTGQRVPPPLFQRVRKIALPLLAERMFMISDVGTPTPQLRENYGHIVDFDSFMGDDDEWWFKHLPAIHGTYKEWRPNGANQK